MPKNEITKLEPRIATFLYHEVTDDPASSGFQRPSARPYKHGVAEFRDHLEAIDSSPISPRLVGEVDLDRPGQHLLLTFDDGGRSALDIAGLLETKGWRGHFFVTTAWIGTPAFLSEDGVRELHRRGHVVGSHSHTHPDVFYDLSREEMLREWRRSRGILEEILGSEVICASVPGGEMNLDTQRSAADAGLKYLFTSEPVLTPWRNGDLVALGRVCPKTGAPLRRVRAFAHHRGFAREILLRRVKNVIKRVYYPLRRALRLETTLRPGGGS